MEEYYDRACKEDILGRTKTRLELWEKHLKDPIVASGKSVELLGESLPGLAFGSKLLVANRLDCNGPQFCGCQDFAKDAGRALLGRRLALPGSMGCCAFAHILQRVDCSREVWAARRALFLPQQEGALCYCKSSAV